jgi:hypothetical protein
MGAGGALVLEARWRSLVPWLNPVPNPALEPTAYSFGSAALHLRFRRRLTADVRWRVIVYISNMSEV